MLKETSLPTITPKIGPANVMSSTNRFAFGIVESFSVELLSLRILCAKTAVDPRLARAVAIAAPASPCLKTQTRTRSKTRFSKALVATARTGCETRNVDREGLGSVIGFVSDVL